MNALSTTLVNRQRHWILGTVMFLLSGLSFAQVPVDENGDPLAYSLEGDSSETEVLIEAPATVVPANELEELVGPIALYPDDLLAVVLPASTYPLEIVQAARFLELLETNSELEPDDEWDESVVALLNYPDVVKMMNDDIDWTWKLGDAVIGQQADVIAAVESFRDRAYAAGNLKSDDRQTVSHEDGIIEIVPVSEEIIYVPYYEPAEVVVYQPRPVYHYYANPYPSYYYPYPAGHRFRSDYFWGVTTAFSIGWSNHYLNVYHPTYWGHPYYGRSYNYYGHYYRRPSINVYNSWYVNNNRYRSGNYYRDGNRWQPRTRAGSRPAEPRVTNRHYPPGTDVRRRQSNAGRSGLDNRANGRMNLGLRERSNAERSRIAATSRGARNQTERLTNNRANLARSNSTSPARTRNNATDRQRSGSNRASDAARAEVDRSNRERVAPNTRTRTQVGSTDNASRGQTATRSNDGVNRARNNTRANSTNRDAIQFRERGNQNRTAATASRAPAPNRNRTTNTTRRTNNVASPSNRTNTTQRTAPRATQTSRPRTAAPVQQRSPAARPTNRSASAPTRSSAPRATAPSRSSAPRMSAPSRATAPRSSAPARSTAPSRSAPPRAAAPRQSRTPRASAPARSAPQRSSAPRASSPPSNRASSSQRSNQSRRGAARPRNND